MFLFKFKLPYSTRGVSGKELTRELGRGGCVPQAGGGLRAGRGLLTRHYCQSIGRYLSAASPAARRSPPPAAAPDTRHSSLYTLRQVTLLFSMSFKLAL